MVKALFVEALFGGGAFSGGAFLVESLFRWKSYFDGGAFYCFGASGFFMKVNFFGRNLLF